MALVIPSIFTAVDKFSGPMKVMENSATGFVGKMNKMDSLVNKLTPSFSEASKQLLSFAGTFAIANGIISGVRWSFDSIKNYETELQNLQAVTGVSGKAFDIFKYKIIEVAGQTKKGAVETAQAFTVIGNAQPELLKNADALAAVTKASITLAQAGKLELAPAADAVTSILNKFGLGAKEAAGLVDMLAAGSVAGSSEIRDTAEAIAKFGTIAATAGIKVSESIALIELASPFDKGAEAGTKLRNVLLKMQNIKVLSRDAQIDIAKAGINMDIVSNSALPLSDRLKEVSKIMKVQSGITHIFEAENQAMAAGILTNVSKLDGMVKAVNTVGQAEKMAALNTDTVTERINQATAAYERILVSSTSVSTGLNVLKGVMSFVADNMESIITVGVGLVGTFLAWKTAMLLTNATMIISRGLANAFFLVDMVKYIASTRGITFATAAWGVVQAELNAMLLANPVGLFIVGVAAASLAIYGLVKAFEKVNTVEKLNSEVTKRALENSIDQRVELNVLFDTLRRAEAGSENYNKVLKRLDELQPGIIDKYNLQAGAIENIARAENELIQTMEKRARMEARSEIAKEKLKEAFQSEISGPSIVDKLKASIGVLAIREDGTRKTAEDFMKERSEGLRQESEILFQQNINETPAINPRAEADNLVMRREEITNTSSKKELVFDFKNMPKWMIINGESQGNTTPSLGSSMGSNWGLNN